MPRFNKSLEPQNVMKEVSQEAKGSKIIPKCTEDAIINAKAKVSLAATATVTSDKVMLLKQKNYRAQLRNIKKCSRHW